MGVEPFPDFLEPCPNIIGVLYQPINKTLQSKIQITFCLMIL